MNWPSRIPNSENRSRTFRSSCNSSQTDGEFIGPAAIVKGYQFYVDEREGEDTKERHLELLDGEHGVWQCHTHFSCTTVCPKDIPITEDIQEL